MMNLKQLINKSVYGTIGYISSQEDLNILEQYIAYNLPVLKEFKRIAAFTNYRDYSDTDLILKNNSLWIKYFPDCVFINNPINRGHNFGTADLDNLAFNYCKSMKIEWLCKSSNDTLLQSSILDKQINEADFYYMNGIGYGGLQTHNFDFDKVIKEDFFPQTNFYFMNIDKVDCIVEKEYLDKTYEYVQSIPNYTGKVWDYVEGWSCETFLRNCINRNNLIKEHLVSEEEYLKLLYIIKEYQIYDPSHKNIMVGGICHYHFFNNDINEIK